MDMTFFPYNDMFSSKIQNSQFKKYYVVKLNNERIKFSHFPYWKKDLLEQAPLKYATYLNNNYQNQLSVFLKSKFHDTPNYYFLESRLTPTNKKPSDWLIWYATFSENKINNGESISLVEYTRNTTSSVLLFTDSFIICKSIIK